MDDAGLTLFDVSQGNGEEARFRRASYLLSLACPHRPPDAGTIGRRNPPNATIMRNICRPGTSGNQRDPEMNERTNPAPAFCGGRHFGHQSGGNPVAISLFVLFGFL